MNIPTMATSSSSRNMLPDDRTPRRAASRGCSRVDERMVVPVGATVKMIVTSNDVIHAWGVPAFWIKIDAVPGRLNETWFKVDRPGVYYGQCYELCGARHGYMPIAVEVRAAARSSPPGSPRRAARCRARSPPRADATAASPAADPPAATARRHRRDPRTDVDAGTATPAGHQPERADQPQAATDMTDTTANAVHFEAARRA